jgi:hypothetical protein
MLAALRVAGAYAVRRGASQREVEPETTTGDGALLHTALNGRRVLVSSAITAGRIRREREIPASGRPARQAADQLDTLDATLSALTRTLYGRDATLREAELDSALESGEELVKRLKRTHRWIAKKAMAASATLTRLGHRVWQR